MNEIKTAGVRRWCGPWYMDSSGYSSYWDKD